jgi:hypothetical protein
MDGRGCIICTNYANSDPPCRVGCVHIRTDLTSGRFQTQVSHLVASLPQPIGLFQMTIQQLSIEAGKQAKIGLY